jgi:hypothetical protein
MGSTGAPANPGLATSIVGLCFGLVGFFVINPFTIAGVAGVVFSIWGLVRSKQAEGRSRTMTRVLAIVGIVLGVLAIVGWILGLFARH